MATLPAGVHRAAAARVLVGGGCAGVVISGFLPWLRLRRTYSGYELARLVGRLGDDYPVVPPSWIGITWYVLPLLAVVGWLVLFRGPRPRVRGVHLVLGGLMSVISLAYGGAAVHYGRLVAGECVAFASSLVVTIGAAMQSSSRAQSGSRTQPEMPKGRP